MVHDHSTFVCSQPVCLNIQRNVTDVAGGCTSGIIASLGTVELERVAMVTAKARIQDEMKEEGLHCPT
jgi:hypothetical protein